MKTYAGVELQLHEFLIPVLNGGELQTQAALPSIPVEQEDGWGPEPVCTQVGRERNSFITATGNRTPIVQPVAESLYCLSYSGCYVACINVLNFSLTSSFLGPISFLRTFFTYICNSYSSLKPGFHFSYPCNTTSNITAL